MQTQLQDITTAEADTCPHTCGTQDHGMSHHRSPRAAVTQCVALRHFNHMGHCGKGGALLLCGGRGLRIQLQPQAQRQFILLDLSIPVDITMLQQHVTKLIEVDTADVGLRDDKHTNHRWNTAVRCKACWEMFFVCMQNTVLLYFFPNA